MVFILSYVALGLVAWDQGDAKKVAYAVDSRGDFCGQKNTPNEMKSVLFYFNILLCSSPVVLLKLHCPTTTVCVSTCPDRFLTFLEVQGRYTFNRSLWAYYQQYCKPGFDNPLKPALDVLRDQDCPPMIIPSRPYFKRCFPDLSIQDSILRIGNQTAFLDGSGILRNVSDLQEAAKDINLIRSMKILGFKILEDFASAWHWIVLALVLAMFSSFLFLLLLRFCASCILWIFVLGVIGIVAYGIGYSYLEYRHLHTSQGAQMTILDLGFHSDYKAYLKLEQTWLLFLILLSIVELLVLFLLLFLRKSIRIAVILLEEGSRIIGHMPQSLLFPLVTVFLVFICIGYWIVIAIFLSTSGEAVYKVVTVDTNCKYANEICNPKSFPLTNVSKECPSAHCNFASFGGKSLLYRWVIPLHAFNTFAFLWLVNFSIALGQCTLAGAFSSYYWAFLKPEDIPPNPICASFGRTLRYHTGSIALGAITLTTVQCLRFFLEYINHHLKDSKRMQSKFILCCCRFCLWCLEKFLKYLNRNAYIMVAIYGDNFCTAAQDAFHLVMRNVVRVAMLDKVTDFLLWLGKMLVSVSIGALGYLFFTQKLPIAAPTLNYYWIPLLVMVLGSYIIAHGFFSVFAMCVDTLFLCFCEDLERNNGSLERPYFMPPTLLKTLGKRQYRKLKKKVWKRVKHPTGHHSRVY